MVPPEFDVSHLRALLAVVADLAGQLAWVVPSPTGTLQ
jgi:hypothetical protein